jgi:dATP pyrophosphohydrolase
MPTPYEGPVGPTVRSRFVAVYPFARVDGSDRMLMLRRAVGAFAGHWYMVTGTIEPGERAWEAALRELREETGLVPRELWSADFTDAFYNPADECIEMVATFVAKVGEDPSPVILNGEADAHEWCLLPEVLARMPFAGHKRALAEVWPRFLEGTPPPWLRIPPTEGWRELLTEG